MLEKVDTRGRIVLGAGALYLILLVAVAAYTAIEFRDLYISDISYQLSAISSQQSVVSICRPIDPRILIADC